jgi:hypothetical protein
VLAPVVAQVLAKVVAQVWGNAVWLKLCGWQYCAELLSRWSSDQNSVGKHNKATVAYVLFSWAGLPVSRINRLRTDE